MKVFVTGISGQLGYDVMIELLNRGHGVFGTARHMPESLPTAEGLHRDSTPAPVFRKLDLTEETAVTSAIMEFHPDAVIHCASWTAVDEAEKPENRAVVFAANVLAVQYIAAAAETVSAKMLYLSSDYVFGGQGDQPWRPEDSPYDPQNYYGETKLLGERAVAEMMKAYYIVRTSWLFGKNGTNFVKTILKLGKKQDAVRVVNDQFGTPTYTRDLARLLADMIETQRFGCYHATNGGGYISWYDFCCEIFRQAELDTKVIPVSTEEYGLNRARRPVNGRLDKSKLTEAGFCPLPDWKDALARYMIETGVQTEWDS